MRTLVCHIDAIPGPIPHGGEIVIVNHGIYQVQGHELMKNDVVAIVLLPFDVYQVPFGHPIRELPNVGDPTR